MRVTVVGGGALGAAAALSLAEAGHTVRLRERGALGSGNSAKAAGIVSSFAWNDADYRLIAETRGAVGELIALAMAAGERNAKGAWRSAPSLAVGGQAERPLLDQLQDRVERHTEECERLDHRRAAAEFPGLRFAPGEEVLVAQEDGVLEAGDLFVALRARLGQEGVEIVQGAPVTDLEGVPDADAVVVAGGAWTKGLLERNGIRLPLQCYRTQLASIAIPNGAGLPILHDLSRHFYARPESEGSILVGDGTQLRPFDPDHYDEVADPEFIHATAERVVARFEDGGEAHVRSGWAGLCVATPDRRPLCGPVPGRPGLFVLTGDNGFGLMRCLALGDRLRAAVGGKVAVDLDPGRFGRDAPLDFEMREGYGAP
ncbi:MAG: FAD-binding oxidoreductase [Halobacteriales archaeon]|nr:FAD-binding oxidoreductase [Halobacteriales archaeon]